MHGRGEEAGGGEECAGEESAEREAGEEGHGKESGGGRDQGPRIKDQESGKAKGQRRTGGLEGLFQCASKLRRILVFVGACLRAILHFTD